MKYRKTTLKREEENIFFKTEFVSQNHKIWQVRVCGKDLIPFCHISKHGEKFSCICICVCVHMLPYGYGRPKCILKKNKNKNLKGIESL